LEDSARIVTVNMLPGTAVIQKFGPNRRRASRYLVCHAPVAGVRRIDAGRKDLGLFSDGIYSDSGGCGRVRHAFGRGGFAAFSLRLSAKPAPTFLYGYEKISFFSAGFEGAMIVLAAVTIIVTSVHEWLAGLKLENRGAGSLLIFGRES
jgi:hypothetical protein